MQTDYNKHVCEAYNGKINTFVSIPKQTANIVNVNISFPTTGTSIYICIKILTIPNVEHVIKMSTYTMRIAC